ncbi:hypothetical protein [Burkholderia gladioli]|uniref:hypothetical protein n=1 Tax=Burkholderia gladioli TaxID=28095 RepID=UPI001640B62D|nr:hypothetical protein [Burkholderia gladioli]
MQLDPRIPQGAALLAGLCVLFAATIGVTKLLHRHTGPAPFTAEQIVAQQVAANPALVSREACIRLALVPLPVSMQDPNRNPLPTEAEAKAHSDQDLRHWLSLFNPSLANMPMNHDQLVMSVMATMPEVQKRRDAASQRVAEAMREMKVYQSICAKTSTAKDRLAIALFRTHHEIITHLHRSH